MKVDNGSRLNASLSGQFEINSRIGRCSPLNVQHTIVMFKAIFWRILGGTTIQLVLLVKGEFLLFLRRFF